MLGFTQLSPTYKKVFGWASAIRICRLGNFLMPSKYRSNSMRYRRSQTPGAAYFFTVVTHGRKKLLCLGENPARLKQAIAAVKAAHPFSVDAIVLLPDHLHCIGTLPPGDNDFSKRWMLIKSKFTRVCDDPFEATVNSSRRDKREQGIWQRRFWEHHIRDDLDFKRHVEYSHYNPVKHGLVKTPIDWRLSSFKRFVADGKYHRDWGANGEVELDADIGRE
jgi:putative transposase